MFFLVQHDIMVFYILGVTTAVKGILVPLLLVATNRYILLWHLWPFVATLSLGGFGSTVTMRSSATGSGLFCAQD